MVAYFSTVVWGFLSIFLVFNVGSYIWIFFPRYSLYEFPVILLLTYLSSFGVHPRLSWSLRADYCWFVFCLYFCALILDRRHGFVSRVCVLTWLVDLVSDLFLLNVLYHLVAVSPNPIGDTVEFDIEVKL